MDSKNQQNLHDMDHATSQSTEFANNNDETLHAGYSNENEGIKKMKEVGIERANKNRLWDDIRFRFFLIILIILAIIVFFFFFNPFGKKETINADGTVSIATPEISGQGTNTIPPEYVEYERQKQAQAAAQAGKNGESYLPEFKTVATDPNAELNDQQFLTGPNGQPINGQQGTSAANPGNISLELDQMARSTMANNTANSTSGLPQPNVQNGNQANQTSQQGPSYQTGYSQQYENAQNATSDINSFYGQQAAAYGERNAAVKELSQAAYLEQLGKYSDKKTEKTGYTSVKYLHNSESNDSNTKTSTGTNLGNLDQANINTALKGPAIIKAGTSMKARLDTGVNTDKGKNLFATIVGGKFNGAKLLGTVGQNTSDIEFRFNRMLFKGEDYSISVRALTLGTKQSGMADKVQKHTLKRIGGIVTAGVFDGYGKAYQNIGQTQVIGNTSVVTTKTEPNDKEIAGNIIGSVGSELSNIARNNLNVQPTYIVNAGKVFEVFFDADVTSQKK